MNESRRGQREEGRLQHKQRVNTPKISRRPFRDVCVLVVSLTHLLVANGVTAVAERLSRLRRHVTAE